MSDTSLTVGAALRVARARGVERLDAQLLLGHLLDRPRSWLIAHDDAALDAEQAGAFDAMLARRAAGEPLAYLVGTKEFYGLTLALDPSVLIPRPETELLVDWALELLAREWPPGTAPRVVDLGTGSGAIALAVKHARPDAAVLATDISRAALAVAQRNAARLGIGLAWLESAPRLTTTSSAPRGGMSKVAEPHLPMSAWWAALGGRRFDLVLANPPYIAAGDPHLAALRHEPALALTPGGDGLDALRAIIAGAPEHLEPGGWLLLEHGHEQADAVCALLRGSGLGAIETRRDLGGQPRCTAAQCPRRGV